MIEWCGARNGRLTASAWTRAPIRLWMRVTSIASALVSGGRIDAQALGEHRLAGARRAAQQQVVPARGGDHDCPDRVVLAAHVRQICSRRRRRDPMASAGARPPGNLPVGAGCRRRRRRARAQRCTGARRRRPRRPSINRASWARAAASTSVRDPAPGVWPAPPPACRGTRARRRRAPAPRTARRRSRPSLRQLSAGREHRARQRQVEAGAGLAHVAGREVRGYAPGRELISGVEDRRLDALARLAHRRVGQPDDRERGQPRADVHLDASRAACAAPRS